MTIGWRNPQEDGYDLSSVVFQYNNDINKVKVQCIDGYANGSISTSFVDKFTHQDYRARHNITIKEWTDYVQPYKASKRLVTFRIDEPQDCELIDSSIDPPYRGSYVESPKEVRQTFVAQYRKPLRGNGMRDVELLPLLKYNITSYFGCYKGEDGSDPN